jgi:hypothetical protein
MTAMIPSNHESVWLEVTAPGPVRRRVTRYSQSGYRKETTATYGKHRKLNRI